MDLAAITTEVLRKIFQTMIPTALTVMRVLQQIPATVCAQQQALTRASGFNLISRGSCS